MAGAGIGAKPVVSSAPLKPAVTVLAVGSALAAALWFGRRRVRLAAARRADSTAQLVEPKPIELVDA